MKVFSMVFLIFVFAYTTFGQIEAVVIKTYTQIHSQPNRDSQVIATITKNEKLNLLSTIETLGWFPISIKNGTGWVKKTDISIKSLSTRVGRGNDSIPYVNSQFNFSLFPPNGAKTDENLNREMESIVSYSCPISECEVSGIFSIIGITPVNVSVAEMVRTLQQKSVQESIAKEVIRNFKPELNATILSKRYVAYNGRPALRIDFNFTKDERSFNGVGVEMFVDEKKILIVFGFFSEDSQSDQWNKISEETIRSFTMQSDRKIQTINPPREGIATRIGRDSTDNTLPPIPKTISGGVVNGKAINLPKPVYPPAARAERASGAVNVQVKIDENGNVVSAKAVSGHPLLSEVSEQAAFKAKFAPTRLAGQPVSVVGVIVYNFVP